ncbi:MAG: nitroreductase family protein [Nitrospiraceae bacterium]|nr:nitroreductase family protein [Nitrospiraceae bacterium]
MDAIETLKTRRSVRRFTPEPVARATIEDMVDCGRLAATARNEQPWEFVVVTDAGVRARLAQLATNGPFIADAPVCIALLCAEGTYYIEDGSAATQNILLAARAYGLGSCWVAGDKKPYADAVLQAVGAPEGQKLVSLIAIGYAEATSSPPKRSLDDVIHWERF